MTDSVVDHIGKSGIVTHGAAVSLTNNTVLGDGATGQETQNGIVLYDATGDVSGNHVSNFIYTGATFSPAANLATGILALNDAGLSFNSNVISEVQDGIAVSGLVAPWVTTIDFSNGNTFSNSNPLFINADKDFLTYDYNTGLFGSSHPLAIIGTDGHDALAGAALADFIDGRGGTDLLGVWDGAADSGKGDDIYRVDSASDLVIENPSEGVDKIESAAATYTLPANVENLTGLGSSPHVLIGNELQNIITGNGGNDLLEGGAESDHLVGGGGIDTASYEHAPGPVHVDLGSFGTLGDAAGDTYVDIQNIVGSAFNDQLTGDGNDNAILGDLGHDSIVGMDGNDTILGDGGNDTLTGNEGNDIILGGDGNDQIGGDAGNDILAGNAGDDTIWGGAGDDQIGGGADNDTLVGEAGNDTIWGEGGNDIINAGADNDIVLGGTGNDQIGGGTGNDILFGEGGNDTIWGEDGTDVIIGGTGNDVLIGGANADTFYFTNGDATDIITDFAPTGAEHDQIWFDHTDLTSFADVLAHATSDGSSTVITYHAGDTLTLNGVTTAQLTAGDFIFT
jgi:Ca2+-binding RTX toxin-like protein